nr:SLOG family protein [Alistipes sp.]
AFTGHRNYHGQAAAQLDAAVDALCNRGFRIFLCGMALGFDMAAAESVLRMRTLRPDDRIRLVAVVPFPGQAARYPAAERERYERILAAADAVVDIAPQYVRHCYALRNDFLIDNASTVVVWYDGSAGGTHYTVRRARRLRREIINLHCDPQAEFSF